MTSLKPALGLVALGILPLYLAEFVAAARANHWMGLRPDEWLLSLAPPLLYWGLISLLTLGLDRGLARLAPRSAAQPISTLAVSATVFAGLCLGIHNTLETSLHSYLGYGLLGSLGILCLVWSLRHATGFAFGPALVAGVAATAAGAFSLHVAGGSMMIRAFGFAAAATVAVKHTALLGSLAIAAGVIAARRPVAGWIVAACVCLIGVGGLAAPMLRGDAAAARTGNTGPNILLITADTMRADYTSLYGGRAKTPVLEALARSGAKFEHAITLAPWTVPALAGMFSSQYPPSVSPGIRGEERDQQLTLYGQIPEYWLGEHGQSLPRRLRDRGYDTAAFVANFAMRKQKWLIDDFDHHLVMQPLMKTTLGPFAKNPFARSLLRGVAPSLYELRAFDQTRTVTELASRFMRFHKAERFFVWAHYLDPHTPYDPPAAFRTLSGPFPYFPYKPNLQGSDQKEYIRSLYSGEISYVDQSIGSLLETLRELGLTDQTYVVFTSDHGEELWDHDVFGHGHSVFDELLHVPLVIAGPGITTQTVSKTVSTIDLLPTLAEWAGLAPDPSWRGSSWAGALAKGSFEPGETPVFSQATGVLPPPPEPLQAVVLGEFKLVRGMETGKTQLYDRSSNPGERVNVAARNPAMVQKLRSALDRWSSSFPATFDAYAEALAEEGQTLEPDAEMLENLKVLGYLPSDTP